MSLIPSHAPKAEAFSATTLRDTHASADASPPPTVADTWATEPQGAVDEDPKMLQRAVLEAGAMLHSSRYRLITALAAYDNAGHWVFTGAITCAHWAANTLGVAVSTAREWLRVGHALKTLPAVAKAMADGRLSYCAVRTLTRVAVDHPENQDELVALAERSRPGEVARNVARWALGHDTEDQHDDLEDVHVPRREQPEQQDAERAPDQERADGPQTQSLVGLGGVLVGLDELLDPARLLRRGCRHAWVPSWCGGWTAAVVVGDPKGQGDGWLRASIA